MLDHLCYAEISTEKINHNIQVIKEVLSDKCKLMVVVKGDAYGHGILPFIDEMDKKKEVYAIAVATIEEAKQCIEHKFKKSILILNHIPSQYIYLLSMNLEQVIFSVYTYEMAMEINQLSIVKGQKVRVHIRIDIYNSGKGMSLQECKENLKELFALDGIQIEGIYAHCYGAYISNKKIVKAELKEFDSFIDTIPINIRKKILIHVATSVTVFSYPEYHYDMVRIGAAVYGFPVSEEKNKSWELKPITSIIGKIINIVSPTERNCIDYSGNSRELKHLTSVAHISFGLWEAPKLMDKKEIHVNINGKITKVIGKPCMDSCCIDITDIDAKVGDNVYFLGEYEGVRIQDKMREYQLGIQDCHTLFAGNTRLAKIYRPYNKDSKTYLMNQVLEEAPTLHKIVTNYRDISILDYLKQLHPNAKEEVEYNQEKLECNEEELKCDKEKLKYNQEELECNQELFEAIYKVTQELFGEEKAIQTKKLLEQTKLLHTANHFGIEYLPQCVQGNLLYYQWLIIHYKRTNIVPLFACTTVSMRSENFPRGILNYYNLSGKKYPLKVPILTNKNRSVMVGYAKGFQKEMVEKAKKQYLKYKQSNTISQETYESMMDILSEYEKEDILKRKTYIEQAALLNERIGKRFIKNKSVSFLYLPMEQIAVNLLIHEIEKSNSVLNHIVWDDKVRQHVLKYLNGLDGCWNTESLEKILIWKQGESLLYDTIGTHYFWGVDNRGVRYPLCFLKKTNQLFLVGITSYAEKIVFEITPKKLKETLLSKKIIPGIFLTFLEIYFLRNVSIAGGCFQENYIRKIQAGLLRAWKEFEKIETQREHIKKKRETVYLSGPLFALHKIRDIRGDSRTVPMGAAEIIEEKGFTTNQLQELLNINLYQSHEMGLFNFYPDIIPKKKQNPFWMDILQR